VARVELTPVAVENLERLILTHSLPSDTRLRLRRSLRVLREFPLIGRQLSGEWEEMRFILGPWRWLLVVYRYDKLEERVFVVTIQDARSHSAATSER
jgi:plasmid stabilization system protein ParE